MKFILLIFLSSIFLACKINTDPKKIYKEFQANNYNLNLSKKVAFKSIKLMLPLGFEKDKYAKYTIKKQDRRAFYSSQFHLYFSIEHYTEQDINMPFLFEQEMKIDFLNLLHDAYMERRIARLDVGINSIKKEVNKKTKFPGVMQTTALGSEAEEDYYMTATLKVKNDYYVFQWIGPREMVQLTGDDFERLLTTVRAIK